jgi:hypothetical protein
MTARDGRPGTDLASLGERFAALVIDWVLCLVATYIAGWFGFTVDPAGVNLLTALLFIAYYVARCNLRSVFTNTSQARPYDEICEMLMQRCNRQQEQTNWWAIAHVLPIHEVICHLDDEQKGVLLAEYFNLMNEILEVKPNDFVVRVEPVMSE